jgi:beta-aspartyl-peptidase (threonine type)
MTSPVIAIHGGAGTIDRRVLSAEAEQDYHAALRDVLVQSNSALRAGASAVEAVTLAVTLLEDCSLFNAGHGAVLTSAGTHELDAAIMDGRDRSAGAIAGVLRVRNPVQGARLVMEKSGCVLLIGAGAELFLEAEGLVPVDPGYFTTPARVEQLQRTQARLSGMALDHDALPRTPKALEPLEADRKLGTVGAVALDEAGNLAAATSTGGMVNKRPGRVGDTPVIGAGCFADNSTAAISTTGTGEAFLRAVTAYDVATLIAYGGHALADAAEAAIAKLKTYGGHGGLIALDRHGNAHMPFSTEGMYRGLMRGDEAPQTEIYR